MYIVEMSEPLRELYVVGYSLPTTSEYIYLSTTKRCDLYFTIEDKLRRFLSCCFTLYKVPEQKQREIIEKVLKIDLRAIAEKIIADTIKKAEEGFETAIIEKS